MSAIDHVNVKIFATPDSKIDWPELIPVFHRWIRENAVPGTPIDVADYAHVPEGPGVLLIAHEAFYSVDNRAGALGFLYNRRTAAEGSTADKVREAYDSALRAARLLEREPEAVRNLRFDERTFEVFINDRALGPNTGETEEEVRPAVEALYAERFGQPPAVERDLSDRRGLFRLRVSPAIS